MTLEDWAVHEALSRGEVLDSEGNRERAHLRACTALRSWYPPEQFVAVAQSLGTDPKDYPDYFEDYWRLIARMADVMTMGVRPA